jgi:hypothetical protein
MTERDAAAEKMRQLCRRESFTDATAILGDYTAITMDVLILPALDLEK